MKRLRGEMLGEIKLVDVKIAFKLINDNSEVRFLEATRRSSR